MIYLNRTCWNGLYRVNKRGEFNVPIGTKDTVILPTDNFKQLSQCLQGLDIRKSDFEPIINSANKGDFLFIDPPYTVQHNENGFLKYNEKIFRWADQIRLHGALVRAKQRGAQILVMNADHESVRSLYATFGTIIPVFRHSVLAASSAKRGLCSELIIRSWS